MTGLNRPFLAAALLATAGGCAQTGLAGRPFAWLGSPPAAESSAKDAKTEAKSDAKETKTAAADKPPEKTDAAKPAEKEAKPEVKPAEVAKADAPKPADPAKPAEPKPAAAPAPAKAAGKPPTVHDAETLALIEEELKHVPPEERDQLYADWKDLDGTWVKEVVRLHRMFRQRKEQAATAAAAAPRGAGSTDPWANASADDGSRVLALGAPVPIEDQIPTATDAAPAIAPAGHSVPPGGNRRLPAVPVSVSGRMTAARGDAGLPAPGPASSPEAEDPALDLGELNPAARDGEAWRRDLGRLIAAAEARAEAAHATFLERRGTSEGPPARRRHVETNVQLRLLYLADGQQAKAMQAIADLDPADQEFWQQVFWGLSNYFDEKSLPERGDRVAQTVQQLRTAVTKLQGEANLELRNVAFCHKITSFGSYERFDRDDYGPGQRVLLYAEIANFKSIAQPSDGLYRTQLKSTIEIFRAGESQPVNKIEFPETVDLCRSYRQDYFHSYELKIPSSLALGPHVLKLTVEDGQSGKLSTYTVNFTVK